MRWLAAVAAVALLAFPSRAEDSVPLAEVLEVFDYRMVGPYRGGRVTAVAGVIQERSTFYMGATGGGVWKTTDAGQIWNNVSDGFFATGAIGAIDVSDSDPNVVYAGTGSAAIRSNIVTGRGVYRSTDAGRTWSFLGLRDSGAIGDIVVHPQDPDVVFVAALGQIFGPNEERGVYRSTDGGASWTKVLEGSERTGAVDLSMDPSNPRHLFASLWRAERKPWTILSGGDLSGLYRSRDGGDTWEQVTDGLPTGLVGKIAVEVSPANPDRVWALVEAEGSARGLYRSDDGGSSFRQVSDQISLTYRPWYYMHMTADPQNEDKIYVNNETLWVSVDGGSSFERFPTPHGDNHAQWIHPADPDLMVQGNDGGANVSLDGGKTWSTQNNQPTAELYQVAVDTGFPTRLYGAQQDNSTISVPSRITRRPLDPKQNWLEVSGCETGPVVPDPRDPRYVYGGCKGRHSVFDTLTGQSRQYWVYPHFNYGHKASDMPFRFQRTAPMIVSPHDPDVIYHGSHVLHRTRDQGATWETISEDLTENDPEFQGYSGGPITRDITGEEIYSTIYAIAESYQEQGVLWVGANDGPVHITRVGGGSWTKITPKGLPRGGRVNRIDASQHRSGTAFVTIYRFQLDDWQPYVYRADDYGRQWTRLTDGRNGIPADTPVRVVREDPEVEGLLYAGTEFGLYLSVDGGESWVSFQRDLPITPVTDIVVNGADLAISTMGRSFWVLDDVTPLREWVRRGDQLEGDHLLAPRAAHRARWVGSLERSFPGFAPEYSGRASDIVYRLAESADEVHLEVLDAEGAVLRTVKGLPKKSGMHRVSWDLRRRGARSLGGGRETPGALVAPGEFGLRLSVVREGETTIEENRLAVLADPRVAEAGVTQADLESQEELATQIVTTLDELRAAAQEIRSQRSQLDRVLERRGLDEEIASLAGRVRDELTAVEQLLLQTQEGKVGAELEPQLQGQITYLYGMVSRADQRPGQDAFDRARDVRAELDELLARLVTVNGEGLAELNRLLAESSFPAISPASPETGAP
ncbi:MAG: hypothetical protein AAGA81_07950 [Acidobacteriota bacterium]